MKRKVYFYGRNTTLHGLQHIVDERKHPLTRLLWTVVFLTLLASMFIFFKESYETYTNNPISFVTETTYLEWNTTFPAITICEVSSSEVFWTPEPGEDYSPVQSFITDIIFFTGSCYSCSTPCDACEKLNFAEITKRYRKECPMIFAKCSWNGKPFDCCDHFLSIKTEYGICFSINSIHTKKSRKRMQLISNRQTGPGELVIEVTDDVRMYFHAPEDVPFINSNPDQRKDISLGDSYSININVIEIANDEGVKDLPVYKRECLFPEETTHNIRVHEFYSYSACVVQCHADAHMQICNCTHHLMPVIGEERFCDIPGLLCLTDNYEVLNRLHAKGSSKPGLVCDCVPSCVEPEYKIAAEHRESSGGDSSEIRIRMQSLPTSRFKRNVVRSTMDLVVSIGGTAGLFIGASILSVIEAPYLLFCRR